MLCLFLSVATGAFSQTDNISDRNASGTVQVSPGDGPNGEAYVTTDGGRINITVLRLNPNSRVFLDNLFKIGYTGDGTAEFWVIDGNQKTTFYAGESRPVEEIENSVESVKLTGDEESPVGVGMKVETGDGSDILSDIELVARLPEEERDGISIDPIDGGDDGGGGGKETPDERDGTTDETTPGGGSGDDGTSTLRIDAGEVEVNIRQPRLRYDITVSEDRVLAAEQDLPGLATVTTTREPETGEEVIVTSEVENVGTRPTTETLELTVDGDTVDTKTIEVEPDETATVNFTLVLDEPGSYAVAVGDSDPVTVTAFRQDISSTVIFAILGALILAILAYRTRKRKDHDGD